MWHYHTSGSSLIITGYNKASSDNTYVIPSKVKLNNTTYRVTLDSSKPIFHPDAVSVKISGNVWVTNFSNMFADCKNLEKVDLSKADPDFISRIGWQIFADCPSLNEVVFPGSLSHWKNSGFDFRYFGFNGDSPASINIDGSSYDLVSSKGKLLISDPDSDGEEDSDPVDEENTSDSSSDSGTNDSDNSSNSNNGANTDKNNDSSLDEKSEEDGVSDEAV